ncbi:hypothetical protein FQR65_LT01604 [Abscondita terminalis]|nr:hypothetical protein FQR65_LT01604 [Abscondita terminalis]
MNILEDDIGETKKEKTENVDKESENDKIELRSEENDIMEIIRICPKKNREIENEINKKVVEEIKMGIRNKEEERNLNMELTVNMDLNELGTDDYELETKTKHSK